jgi:hypothetical protein
VNANREERITRICQLAKLLVPYLSTYSRNKTPRQLKTLRNASIKKKKKRGNVGVIDCQTCQLFEFIRYERKLDCGLRLHRKARGLQDETYKTRPRVNILNDELLYASSWSSSKSLHCSCIQSCSGVGGRGRGL